MCCERWRFWVCSVCGIELWIGGAEHCERSVVTTGRKETCQVWGWSITGISSKKNNMYVALHLHTRTQCDSSEFGYVNTIMALQSLGTCVKNWNVCTPQPIKSQLWKSKKKKKKKERSRDRKEDTPFRLTSPQLRAHHFLLSSSLILRCGRNPGPVVFLVSAVFFFSYKAVGTQGQVWTFRVVITTKPL